MGDGAMSADRFDAWSFVRDVLVRGAAIEADTRALGRGYEQHSFRLDDAARELADRLKPHLAKVPADDGEPLTDAFLASCGSDTESAACENGHEFKLRDGSLLFLWGYEGEGHYSVTLAAHPELERHADDVSGEINLPDIYVRGEFRRLAKVLGLKEPGA